MDTQLPFIKVFVNAEGQVQMETNITDPAQANWYLDIAKHGIMANVMKPQTQVQPVGASALSALSNGKTVPISR